MTLRYWALPSTDIKNINKNAILDLIRFTPGGISRAEIAHQIGLTRAAVSAIISDLVSTGVVQEGESRSTHSGRKPVVLEINPERGRVVGIDIGATHATALVADFSARILAEREIAFDIHRDPALCLFEIDTFLRDTIHQINLSVSDLSAVGVGIPGPIALQTGSVVAPPLMPGWDHFPIKQTFESFWHLPVCLYNDAELGATGEWAYGAGRGEEYMIYIKVGTGVGAGILLHGNVYRGATGAAGEIGHVTIDENGPLCSCGNQGCLEAMVGGRAIVALAAKSIEKGQRTQMAFISSENKLCLKDVIDSARNGDLIAQKIMIDAGNHLGTAIAGLVNLFNPGMIVVGGGVAQVGDLILEPVRRMVEERSLKASSHTVRIASALLGRRSVAMGGVVQALTASLHHTQPRKEAYLPVEMNFRNTQTAVSLHRE